MPAFRRFFSKLLKRISVQKNKQDRKKGTQKKTNISSKTSAPKIFPSSMCSSETSEVSSPHPRHSAEAIVKATLTIGERRDCPSAYVECVFMYIVSIYILTKKYK